MERTSNRGRPKGSRGGGRGKSKRGRKPKVSIVSDEEIETNQQEEEATNKNPENDNGNEKTPSEVVVEDEPMETAETDDVSNLEAPSSFTTTLQRNVPQIMLRLNWDHKVNLFSEKVLNPMIYCCDQCGKPILIYGRMIPCKHVFCYTCARTEAMSKQCPRCKEKVVRVEQTGLGTVFMCTFDGERYGKTGCRRTYLSQRDLQAHINHRHVTTPTTPINHHLQDIKVTDKTNSVVGQPQQPNSHLRKDSMVISPPSNMKQPFNSLFPSSVSQRMNDNSQQQSSSPMNNSHSSASKLQDSHGYYNNQYGHQFNNNGAGGSSSSSNTGVQNNFYQSSYNNLGHYSQAPQQSQHNWNQQQQQYYR